MSNLNKFISKLKTESIADTNRFTIFFTLPKSIQNIYNLESILLYCDSVVLPGLNINTTPSVAYGENFELPYEKLYSPCELEFYVDKNLVIKELFDLWIQSIQDPVTKQMRFYYDYCTDIDIFVQDRQDKNVYKITLHEAYPKTLGDIRLDYSSRELMKLTTTLTYRNYKTERIISNEFTGTSGKYTNSGLVADSLFDGTVPKNYLNNVIEYQNQFDVKKITNSLSTQFINSVKSRMTI